MKNIILLSLCLLTFSFSKAQFTITSGQTADQLAQYLGGSGVTISNAL